MSCDKSVIKLKATLSHDFILKIINFFIFIRKYYFKYIKKLNLQKM